MSGNGSDGVASPPSASGGPTDAPPRVDPGAGYAFRARTLTETTEANASRSGAPSGSASRPTV